MCSNTTLFVAITLSLAWCDRMLFWYTLWAAADDRHKYVFSEDDVDGWIEPEAFQRAKELMPVTWRAAWGRIKALMSLKPQRL